MRFYSKNKIDYECVKEITKELKKRFKGIQANSYGYCCNSDYDAIHKYINEDDYVCAKIYKGGLNNDYHYDSYYEKSYFALGDTIYYCWCLTNFKLEDVINTMQEIANNYGYKVYIPHSDNECIKLYIDNSMC